jgi:iron complex outermembrane receptor protein
MNKRIKADLKAIVLLSNIAFCLSATSYANAGNRDTAPINYFELSLEELMNITIDVSGYSVSGKGLHQTASTSNPLALQNITSPYSIHIVNAETIRARGLKNVVDAVSTTPGILSGNSPSEPYSFSMRGFSRNSVGILFDGVSMGLATLNMRPQGTNNLESIEIIKGPVVLHSEGVAAGTINMIPKRASITQHHIQTADLSYGSYDSRTASMNLSGPVNDDSAYLLHVARQTSNGWIDDASSETTNVNASIRTEFSDNLAIIVSLDYLKDDLPNYWGTPLIPRQDAIDPISVVSSNSDLVIDGHESTINYNVKDSEISSESLWASVDLEYEISDSITGKTKFYHFGADRDWRNAESYIYDDATGLVDRDRLLVSHDRELWGAKSGITLSNTIANLTNQLSVNVEYRDLDFSRDIGFDDLNFFVDFVDFKSPSAGIFNTGNIEQKPDYYKQNTAALVIEDNLEITEDLNWHTGIRTEYIKYEREKFNFDGSLNVSGDDSLSLTSYQTGLSYSLFNQTYLYGHYSSHHDAFSAALSAGSPQNFNESEVEQYEVGLKSISFDQKLEINATVYRIKKEQKLESPNITNTENSQGLELSINLQASENFKVGTDYAYTDANFDDYYNVEMSSYATDNKPINVPKEMASIWVSYNKIAGLPIEVNFSSIYVSKRFANTANDVSLNSYQVFNGFISYTGRNYRVTLYGRNLTDEVYAPYADFNYPAQVLLADPRTFELDLRVSF